jgi:hypothetical protein
MRGRFRGDGVRPRMRTVVAERARKHTRRPSVQHAGVPEGCQNSDSPTEQRFSRRQLRPLCRPLSCRHVAAETPPHGPTRLSTAHHQGQPEPGIVQHIRTRRTTRQTVFVGFLNLVSAVRSSPGAPQSSCSGRFPVVRWRAQCFRIGKAADILPTRLLTPQVTAPSGRTARPGTGGHAGPLAARTCSRSSFWPPQSIGRAERVYPRQHANVRRLPRMIWEGSRERIARRGPI